MQSLPRSLHRTWASLAVATLAVLAAAFLAGRDFVRNFAPECPGSLVDTGAEALSGAPPSSELDAFYFDAPDESLVTPEARRRSLQLRFEERKNRRYSFTTQYDDVRVEWWERGSDGAACKCGTAAVPLSGEGPSDLRGYRSTTDHDLYVVKGRHDGDAYATGKEATRTVFRIVPGRTRHLQWARVLTVRNLPVLVVLVALVALGVALLRSRRAMSYALGMHRWTEGRITADGLIESETGMVVGKLEQTRQRNILPGAVLVAPEALAAAGLYRDMPVVARGHVAEGTHSRWATATMIRLRDARALAVISTLCTALALGARLLGS